MNSDTETLNDLFAERIRRRYDAETRELRETLACLVPESGDLTRAVRILFEHQYQTGVIRNDLHEVERFQMLDPADAARSFYCTVNPLRAERHRGGDRAAPPPGWTSHHGNCFLCAPNIEWQQRFSQYPMSVELTSGRFNAWVNPFPLGKWHITLASESHRPQRWLLPDPDEAAAGLKRRLGDLIELACRLPRFLVFENGDGAGASIPHHHHYQALCRWPGLEHFPIEVAARRQAGEGAGGSPFLLRDYPVAAIACQGGFDATKEAAGEAADRWLRSAAEMADGDWSHLTANLIASRARADRDEIVLFIVPRNGHINRSHGADSTVASLEIAGEMILSDPRAGKRIRSGQIGFRRIWDTIASCQDIGSRRLLEKAFPAPQ